jgi:hypothetical protein
MRTHSTALLPAGRYTIHLAFGWGCLAKDRWDLRDLDDGPFTACSRPASNLAGLSRIPTLSTWRKHV